MEHFVRVLLIAGAGLACFGCQDAHLQDIGQVEAQGRFLVSPRWSEDGEKLWAAGKGGIGGFRVSLENRRVTGRSALPPDRIDANLPEGLRFDPYLGRILQGEAVLASDAWGIRGSPDLKQIAYCTGHLSNPRLHVMEADGQMTFEGPGAQPAWHPDGTLLIFTRPESSGSSGLREADLYLLDLASGDVSRLTETAGAVEMQPAVSPDGSRLAFVDWASGNLLVADLIVPGGGS